MPTAQEDLNSSDEEEGPLDPVAEARRQRAIQLLAKVLKKPVESNDSTGKPQASAADTDAEVRFLQELLNDLQKGVPATKVASGIRDRLSVLGIRAPFRKEEEKVGLVIGDPDFFDFLD
jgi:hypothetical protein